MNLKIVNYKKLKNGMYTIKLEDSREITLYQEVILEYELLLDKNIDNDKLVKINLLNKKWEVYYTALKILKSRFRSRKELFDLLIKKDFPSDLVSDSLDKLEKQGYINDLSFAKSYMNNQVLTTNRGPNRISNDLLGKGVSVEIIEEVILEYDINLQREKIIKLVDKYLKSNRSRSGNVLKMKIINDLLKLGYDRSTILGVVDNMSFEMGDNFIKAEYEKLYRKYSRKYSGKELEYKIRQKLYQKGIVYED